MCLISLLFTWEVICLGAMASLKVIALCLCHGDLNHNVSNVPGMSERLDVLLKELASHIVRFFN